MRQKKVIFQRNVIDRKMIKMREKMNNNDYFFQNKINMKTGLKFGFLLIKVGSGFGLNPPYRFAIRLAHNALVVEKEEEEVVVVVVVEMVMVVLRIYIYVIH